jgi:chemotaxis-related protein WspD
VLPAHGHCRHCDVFAAGARQHLQVPVPDDYRAHWAGLLAHPPALAQPGVHAVMVFRIGAEWLALPLVRLRSVTIPTPTHRVPHRSAPGLLGVTGIGGRLLPALDLGQLLGLDAHAPVSAPRRQVLPRQLVLDADGVDLALPVADLFGVLRYHADTLRAAPATVHQALRPFLSGVLDHEHMAIGCLDAASLARHCRELLR